jgi:hypothetical protein
MDGGLAKGKNMTNRERFIFQRINHYIRQFSANDQVIQDLTEILEFIEWQQEEINRHAQLTERYLREIDCLRLCFDCSSVSAKGVIYETIAPKKIQNLS